MDNLTISILGNQIFPSKNWTSGNFSAVSRELRVEISQITNRINTLLSINQELSTQKNENDFVDSRSSFYAKYIRGTTRDKGLLGQIFDPSNQKLLVRPDEVKQHVFDEKQKHLKSSTDSVLRTQESQRRHAENLKEGMRRSASEQEV